MQKTSILASGPVTSWQIDGETVESVTDFILGGSKIAADGHCSHEIKTLASWKKNYEKHRQQRYHFAGTGPYSQSYGFLVVMYGCENWTLKKAEAQRIDAFKL